MRQVAEAEGLPFGDRTMTYNTRLAQELGKWAESTGEGHAFHLAAFQAYFAAGKNIGHIPVLIDLSHSLGLPRDGAKRVLEERTFKEDVDEDWILSRKRGITAVPTFIINGRSLVGAHPYEAMEQFLKECNVKERRTGA